MRRNKVRFGAIAAALVLAVVFLGTGTDKAWSVEQTIAAMKKIESVHITGTNLCHGKPTPFDCWVYSPAGGTDSLKLRYQCRCDRNGVLAVQGGTVYAYLPPEKVIRIRDGSQIEDLQYWYEGAKLSPWLTGKLLETLKLVGRGWQQRTETDPNTGAEQIVITCSHPPSSVSFLLVVDPESKLIRRAKLWKNLRWQGEPMFDARVFTYNPDLAADFFEIKAPPEVIVLSEEAEEHNQALFDRAERLLQEARYAEARELYQQVHDAYPNLKIASEALMMVGLCHDHLGQPDREIEAYRQAINEYPTLSGWNVATYYYLGRAYLDQGQNEKALEAFEHCLAAGAGVSDPEKFPLKDAREAIAKIRGQ
ncbi:MAG: tetratricopeptide repeat protein [Phycisphaerales bacterium]